MFQKMLLLLITGVSVTTLGIAGCTAQQQDSAAEVKPPVLTSQTETPTTTTTQPQERPGDVPYVPTPQPVVDAMLQVAKVGKNDVLYDLGSGDGRIVVTAAQKYGTRGVGIDISPERIQEANANAQKAGVTDLVEFRQQDLFKTDLSQATVITLYLLPEVNLRLRPELLKLKPGTRIVSHAFDMGDWKPQQTLQVDGKTIYYWVVPQEIPANLR
ncbi:class I SAM-dependent methyltransferase [Nostoc sp. FACHB-87]|uniref:SAM-dependent methyltransferase n=1 Tax=Nostocales TaxID=1161 RepID=UPI0016883955|nr:MULTISPECIES: methyltransferase domain-containing protein [Nostocales]MBD2455111.1 class I SAM-dependent methyltransferase [Nostoc sp. FACHB-87]MBD2477882.1 class I SAM-dependent methyltransferase [Anabaena sp. FACHB-83]MBD2487294.1 class I SAM-dependent methyltransferase [Aulosira sp. FACHB-615]